MMTHSSLNTPVQPLEMIVDALAPSFEIDAVDYPELGTVYSLWQGSNLLGTFYCDFTDGKWVVEPSCSGRLSTCDSAEQAQMLIITVSSILVGTNSN